jgi:hypothetical protein
MTMRWFTIMLQAGAKERCVFSGLTTLPFAMAAVRQIEKTRGPVKLYQGKAVPQLFYETGMVQEEVKA